MGKTFVEDERPCDSCVNVTRYGCVSWNCEYINRDEAIKAWREKHETADRKTENCSEKPNNCEDCIWSVCNYNKAFKDEPQTETEIAKAIVHKMIDDAVIAEDAYPDLRQKMHDAVDEYEPQTDCAWK